MSVAAQVSDDLLDALGLESWDHAPSSLSRRGLTALNQILQQIYAVLPDDFWSRSPQRSISIHAPTLVDVEVAVGTKQVEFVSGLEEWMKGCTLVLSGDPAQNRLVSDAAPCMTLWKDYMGPNDGVVSATVYQDRLHVPDAAEILGPVMLDGHWELVPVSHERIRQISNARTMSQGSSPRAGNNLFPLSFSERNLNTPQAYLVEPFADYQSGPRLSLLLDALPPQAYRVSLEVKMTAPAPVASWEDPRSYLVPHNYTESILLPMVRYAMASHPNFPKSQQELKPDFDTATKVLQSLRPQGFTPSSVHVGSDW